MLTSLALGVGPGGREKSKSVAAFLSMGGYGGYVWSAFGFTLIVMGTLFWQSWRLARKRTAEAEALRTQRRTARPASRRPLVAARSTAPAGNAGEPRG